MTTTIKTSEAVEFRIPRTGDTSLIGTGRLIASINGDPKSKTKQDDRFYRWHNLALYQTAGGKFVLHIAYRSNYRAEKGNDRVQVFATAREALFFAREVYNPLEFYIGIPTWHPTYPRDAGYKARFVELYRADCQSLAAQATESGTLGETKID